MILTRKIRNFSPWSEPEIAKNPGSDSEPGNSKIQPLIRAWNCSKIWVWSWLKKPDPEPWNLIFQPLIWAWNDEISWHWSWTIFQVISVVYQGLIRPWYTPEKFFLGLGFETPDQALIRAWSQVKDYQGRNKATKSR